MVKDVNYTYWGDHSAIYTNIEPLCYTLETNVMLYINYKTMLTASFASPTSTLIYH